MWEKPGKRLRKSTGTGDIDMDEKQMNTLTFDDKKFVLTITLHMDIPGAVCAALGSLEIAKDQVKQIAMVMGAKKKMQGIVVPGENGAGGLHAL